MSGEAAEHAVDWTLVIIALAGIGGTFAAAWYTSRNAREIHTRTLAHQERTRFHDDRLKSYTRLQQTSSYILSHFSSGRPLDSNELQVWANVRAEVSFLATPAVERAAVQLGNLIVQLAKVGPQDRQEVLDESMHRLSEFTAAARRELGMSIEEESE